ncbi:MAG TPA: gamma-glutamyl-gamma-aminobutyrate hydrolase family protein [Alphaproteobacteria bacterium]|nr:gamma-glutamyl-gamma-aminobutyrate hydrolase family protein [Alphaproteobacteria bacterium]
MSLPLVGIPTCTRQLGEHPFHVAGEKYILAVSQGAGALPLLIPSLGAGLDVAAVVARLDGLLMTGSPSNVEPSRYAGPPAAEGTLQDLQRDATTLPLIPAALAAGVPLLAICRGHQELNVALGGSLHQAVQTLPGRMDHRNDGKPAAEQYAPFHPVRLTPGGLLARIAGREEVVTNSVHAQAIDRLADGLAVEAVAADGTIEAVRVRDAGFAVGVQFHPEWRFWEDDFSTALFKAFGAAVQERAARRAGLQAA